MDTNWEKMLLSKIKIFVDKLEPQGKFEGTYQVKVPFAVLLGRIEREYPAGTQCNVNWYPGLVAISHKNSSPTEFFADSQITGFVFKPQVKAAKGE
jgi:hypothetical protein